MSAKHAVWRALAAVKRAAGVKNAPGLRVLGYHAVGTAIPGDPYGLCVSPTAFKRHVELIATGRFGKPVCFGQARMDGASEIAVTFDDGYEDTFTTAAPMLVERNIPFTVFATPGLLDSGRPHMTWDELKRLAAMPGCEIGAHGLTHARLDLLDDGALARELTESKRRLEDAIARPVAVMSWPHGAVSRRAAEAAEKAGYRRAGSSLYGVNLPGRDAFILKRTEITAFDGEDDFIGKCGGDWDWFALRQGDPFRA